MTNVNPIGIVEKFVENISDANVEKLNLQGKILELWISWNMELEIEIGIVTLWMIFIKYFWIYQCIWMKLIRRINFKNWFTRLVSNLEFFRNLLQLVSKFKIAIVKSLSIIYKNIEFGPEILLCTYCAVVFAIYKIQKFRQNLDCNL